MSKAFVPTLEQIEKGGALKSVRAELLMALNQLSEETWREEPNKKEIVDLVGCLSVADE